MEHEPDRPGMPQECRLLAGPKALFAQVLLGFIAVCGLLYKRHRERPQRPVKIWAMDVSKQAVSTLAAHVTGISIAVILASRAYVSECAWYVVAFTFDTTLGVAIALGLHTAAVSAAKRLVAEEPRSPVLVSVADCGNYGVPPSVWRLLPQLVEFTVAVLIARACCGMLIYMLKDALTHIAHVLDDIFRDHPVTFLYFVMIAWPLAMNLLQVLIQDTVLKRHRPGSSSHESSTSDPDTLPLADTANVTHKSDASSDLQPSTNA